MDGDTRQTLGSVFCKLAGETYLYNIRFLRLPNFLVNFLPLRSIDAFTRESLPLRERQTPETVTSSGHYSRALI